MLVPHPANNSGMLMSFFSPCFVTRRLKYPIFRPPRALQDKKLAYFIPMSFTGFGTSIFIDLYELGGLGW
jgi:hypothetical protein